YYGWAPMSPGISLNVHVGIPMDFWVFIPTTRIYDRYIPRYWSSGRNYYNRTTIINNTYIVNNRNYYGGPARRDIERSIGRNVPVRNVRFNNSRSGRGGRVDSRSVSIYRPNGNRTPSASTRRSATVNRGN